MVESDFVHLVLTTNDQRRSIDVSLWSFETLGNGVTVARLTLETYRPSATLQNAGFFSLRTTPAALPDTCQRVYSAVVTSALCHPASRQHPTPGYNGPGTRRPPLLH